MPGSFPRTARPISRLQLLAVVAADDVGRVQHGCVDAVVHGAGDHDLGEIFGAFIVDPAPVAELGGRFVDPAPDFGRPLPAIAPGAPARRHHHLLCAPAPGGGEQVAGAVDVDAHLPAVMARPDRGVRGQVKDGVGALGDRFGQGRQVEDVAPHPVDGVAGQGRGIAVLTVERRHAPAGGTKLLDQVEAEKSGGAGDEGGAPAVRGWVGGHGQSNTRAPPAQASRNCAGGDMQWRRGAHFR